MDPGDEERKNRRPKKWQRVERPHLFASGDGRGGRWVVVDEDTDTSSWRAELDLGALGEGGLGEDEGAVEAGRLALRQATIALLVLLLTAGLEGLLGHAGDGEPSL